MKKILLSVLFATGSLFGFGQAPAMKWQKSFGGSGVDKANAIQQATDGGYILAGESSSTDDDITASNGAADYWIVKIDTVGTIIWQKSLGGTGDDRANSVIQTSDGGYIVAGTSNSSGGDVTAPKGNYDFWIVRLTSAGAVSWQKSLGGTAIDEAKSIQQTTDGGYIIAGDTRSNNYDVTVNNGNTDFWVAKTDASGVIQWQKSLGGTGTENASCVKQTADGGYIVTGQTNSNDVDVAGNNGGVDYWVTKLSTTGSLQWQKCLGGSGDDVASSIIQTSDGGYLVAGKAASTNGNVTGNNGAENAWLVKLNSTGGIDWQQCYGGAVFDGAASVVQTSDGGYAFGGVASSNTNDVSGNHGSNDFWAVKLTATGTISWQKCLGGTGSDAAACMQQTSDNGYILAGHSGSINGDITNPKGADDYWAVRLAGSAPTNTTTNPTTGISELNNNEETFTFYPNPGNGIVTVVNKSAAPYNIVVFDALGKTIYENKGAQQKFTFDISGIAPKGIYFLSLSATDGSSKAIKKLVFK